MNKYKRTLTQLGSHAVLSWPHELIDIEANVSVLPFLYQTQDEFISILNLSQKSPDKWKAIINASNVIGYNQFLKHLMVLSDLGGEALNKLPPIINYFPKGIMNYVWDEVEHTYRFQCIQNNTTLHNKSLCVDGKSLFIKHSLTPKIEDTTMLLLFGSLSLNDKLPEDVKIKCCIGGFIGRPEELKSFVKQSYIRVSRQTSGATANSLGQLAQKHAIESLVKLLPGWSLFSNGTLPNLNIRASITDTTFDIVAKSPTEKYYGIEVSFQVTTNSTIERKSAQAKDLYDSAHRAGHKVCYIIDGAGNINIRKSAVSTLCEHSDCTVAYSQDEFKVLAKYLMSDEKKSKG